MGFCGLRAAAISARLPWKGRLAALAAAASILATPRRPVASLAKVDVLRLGASTTLSWTL